MSEKKQPITPHIQVGHTMINEDVISVPIGKVIRFIAEDGKCCMEVSAEKKEGKPLTIEIRGSDNSIQDGVLYDTKLAIVPVVSNSILVTNIPYHKGFHG